VDEATAQRAIDAGLRLLGSDDVVAVESAIGTVQSALQVVREPGYRRMAHLVLGTLYGQRVPGDRSDNLERAIGHLTQGLAVESDGDGDMLTVHLLHNLGRYYKDRIEGSRADNLERAIGFLQRALAATSEAEYPAAWATTAAQLGNTYNERISGDHAANVERALELHKQALALRPRESHPVEWAITMHDIAGDLLARSLEEAPMANLLAARRHLEAALEVRIESALPEHFALTQLVLAECLTRLASADPEHAAAHLDAAIASLQAAGRVWTIDQARSRWLQIQLQLADAYARRAALVPGGGDAGTEIPVLERLLLAASPSTDSRLLATVQGQLAQALLRRGGDGDLDRAHALADEASRVFEADGAMLNLSLMTRTMGAALSAAGRWDEAAAAYERALRAESYLNEAALSVTTQRAHLLLVSGLHEDAAYAFAKSSRHRWADVLVALELGRARALGDAITRANADLTLLDRHSVGAAEAKRRFLAAEEALRALTETELRGGALATQPPPPGDLQRREQAQNELRQAIASIRSIPGFTGFLSEPDLDTVLAAVTPGCPLIYLFTTPRGGYAVAVYRDAAGQPAILAADLRLTADDLNRLLLPEGEAVQAVAHWPGLLFAQRLNPQVLDEVLAQVLPRITVGIAMPVGSLLRRIGAQRAALVPCGRLGALPIAAAPLIPRTGSGTSPDVVPLSGTPPAPGAETAVLDFLALRITPSARIAAIAHPGAGAVSATSAAGATGTAGGQAAARGGRRYLGVASATSAAPLPWAPSEVRRVAKLVGGTAPLTGPAASRRAVRTAIAQTGGGVVHLACHGVFDMTAPDRSGLALADGPLPLLDIMASAMFGGVRLVVASACETASADVRLPDEPTGMASAFLQAGAAAALGALWPVNDLSASLLASRVAAACCDPAADHATELARAQAWLRDLDAAAAVRAASELLAEADPADRNRLSDDVAYLQLSGVTHPFRAPFHWAPYILVSGPA
jgi:tetratricopeptide (TPR) repeat protein